MTENRVRSRQNTATAVQPYIPRKEGYLGKKYGTKGYKQRWLEIDGFNDHVYYYNENPALGLGKSRLRGSINLAEARIDAVTSNQTTKPKIVIRTKTGTKVELAAKDEIERDAWLKALIVARDSGPDTNMLISEWKKSKDCASLIVPPSEAGLKQDDEAADPVYDFFSLTARDLNGVDVRLGDIVSNRLTVILFLRQYGCPNAKLAVQELIKSLDQLDDLGVQLILVGTGSPASASNFKKQLAFPGQIYSDPDEKLYYAFGCRRGWKLSYSLQALAAAQIATQEFDVGETQGDPLQLGGLFALSKDDGFIFQHQDKYAGHLAETSELLHALGLYVRGHLDSMWATPPPLNWNDLYHSRDKAQLVSVTDRAYRVERGTSDAQSTRNVRVVENVSSYQRFFSANDHQIWVTEMPTESAANDGSMSDRTASQIAVAAVEYDINRDKRLLLLHSSGEYRRTLADSRYTTDKEMLNYLTRRTIGVENLPFVQMESASLPDELILYESQSLFKQFKFGVLYARDGQMVESEMYFNMTENTSADYNEFLQMLGSTVRLKGWPYYRGGLDNKKDASGTHSIFSTIEDISVMYHVSTMLPLDTRDNENPILERKRHIGNDVVVLIFKEGNTPIDPSTAFRSQFNHAFVVVSKDERRTQREDGRVFYRVEIVTKPGVPPSFPLLPDPPLFEKGAEFRNFLLSKMVNLEKAVTREVPAFKAKMGAAKGLLLRDVIRSAFASTPPSTPSSLGPVGLRGKIKKAKSDARVENGKVVSREPSQSTISSSSGSSRDPSPKVIRGKIVPASRENSATALGPPPLILPGTAPVTQPLPPQTPSKSKESDIFLQLEADIDTLTEAVKTGTYPLAPSSDKPLKSPKPAKPVVRSRDKSKRTSSSEPRTLSGDLAESATMPPAASPTASPTASPKLRSRESARELEESNLQLQRQLAELEAVERQVASKVSTQAPAGSSPAIPTLSSSRSSEALIKNNSSALQKKDSSFAQLQNQWKNIAESNASSTNGGSAKRASGPLAAGKSSDAALLEAVQQLIKATSVESSKRLIVTFGPSESNKDIVVVSPDVRTAAELRALIEKELARKVKDVTFEGVIVQDKHIKALHDKDVLRVSLLS